MKKSVVALAVLSAFTGLASAQSSVTLYGRLDQNVTQVDPGSMGKAGNSSTTNAGSSVTKLNDGSVNGLGASRFGMRGVEDMGDGVKAYFKLESGISVDSGVDGGATQTSTTSMFNREAYVGLGSTTWGDIRFGRLETLSREVNRLINDASGENQLNIAEVMDVTTPAGGTYKQNRVYFNNFGTRVDNAISYRSPSFMGMAQMVATYGLSEGAKAPDGNSQAAFGSTNTLIKANIASYTGIGIILTAGPLAADLVYEQLNGGGQSGGSFGKTATMGLSYDLEFAKFYVAFRTSLALL
jgi:predicted porin